MAEIKAIETVYKGFRMRSRLEARWGVFFDYCEYPWEYEPEGYKIDGISYLPDFKVKRLISNIPVMWFEVKPSDGLTGKQQDDADKKMRSLARESGIPGVLVFGPPWDSLFCLYKQTDIYSGDGLMLEVARYPGIFQNCYNRMEKEAAEAAKGARFEHGEHGR